MFYVAEGKVYADTFDDKLGVYPEIRLGIDTTGITMTVLKTGVAKKPKNRQVCSKEEVIAQLGGSVVSANSTNKQSHG